jgi:hypothetical protein
MIEYEGRPSWCTLTVEMVAALVQQELMEERTECLRVRVVV